MDGIVDGSWCVMLYDVIQWSDKDPGVMRHWSHGHNIPGTQDASQGQHDGFKSPATARGGVQGEACARLPGPRAANLN